MRVGISTVLWPSRAPVLTQPSEPAPSDFDAWLAAMPTELAVGEHLAILELAKSSASALRSMRPALYNPVSNALPTWSQLIIAVEKLLK